MAKKKSVKFQSEGDAEAGEVKSKGKFRPPDESFVRVKPKALPGGLDDHKDLVVIQVPDEVDLREIDGCTLGLDGDKLGGTLSAGTTSASTSGRRYAVHQEDDLYAQQFVALVPSGGKYLKVKRARHMLVLSEAKGETEHKGKEKKGKERKEKEKRKKEKK